MLFFPTQSGCLCHLLLQSIICFILALLRYHSHTIQLTCLKTVVSSGFQYIYRIGQPSPQLILEHFHHPRGTLVLLAVTLHFLPFLSLPPHFQATAYVFCLSGFAKSVHFAQIESYSTCTFVIDFFIQHVPSCCTHISSSLLFIAEQYSIVWLYHILFIHSSVEGHLAHFHISAIISYLVL